MPVSSALTTFKADIAQCEALIANAHGTDASTGNFILPALDREQITVAAFLNLFIAWETFIEAVLAAILTGAATLNGNSPIRFASPPTVADAKKMMIGINRYFDYGNHFNVRKMVSIFLDQGLPFEPHLSGIQGTLDDLRVMRNAAAHITSTTQVALETLALRLLSTPSPGIKLYSLLTALDPRSTIGGTIFQTYRDLLIVTADLIANG